MPAQPSSTLSLVSDNQLLQPSCKLPGDQQGTDGTYSSGSQPSKLLITPSLRYGGSFLHSLSLGYLSSLFLSFQSINAFLILINAIYPVPRFKTNWYGFWSPKWTLSDTTKNDTVGVLKEKSFLCLRTMAFSREKDSNFNPTTQGGLSKGTLRLRPEGERAVDVV